jgi:hypothetical protein
VASERPADAGVEEELRAHLARVRADAGVHTNIL